MSKRTSKVLVQGTADVPETTPPAPIKPVPVVPASAGTSSFAAPAAPAAPSAPSAVVPAAPSPKTTVKQIAKKTVKPKKVKKPIKPRKPVKSTVKSVVAKTKTEAKTEAKKTESPSPYRPTSMYGLLFLAAYKKFMPRQETIEAISKQTGKKAIHAFQVLKNSNHFCNNGRSRCETRTTKDGIEEIKFIALK